MMSPMSLRLSDYDYMLPEELIAMRPMAVRSDSRMMVLHRSDQRVEHRKFSEIASFILPGDLLVLNDTKVLRARRFSDDGAIECLFIERLGPRRWKCLVRPGKKMRIGASVRIAGETARVEEIRPAGERIIAFKKPIDPYAGGSVPLPPYIDRQSDADDLERYQTVYARVEGAIAAPTAGLHFTPEMLSLLSHTFVTLHVGAGTFRPVQDEDISKHAMHAEQFAISASAATAINAAARVIAVGTTTVRVLESARRVNGALLEQHGATEIFIHPPATVRHADMLLTNFHLPRSTLLMLVSAFAGRKFVLAAYAEAVRQGYRFYSYGDCMLLI